MIAAPTYFGRYYDFGVDKDQHLALITVAIPLRDGGDVLDKLAAFHAGIGAAPIAIAMQVGQTAAALQACLDPDAHAAIADAPPESRR